MLNLILFEEADKKLALLHEFFYAFHYKASGLPWLPQARSHACPSLRWQRCPFSSFLAFPDGAVDGVGCPSLSVVGTPLPAPQFSEPLDPQG